MRKSFTAKKTPLLIYVVLAGPLTLALLVVVHATQPVIATGPTPIPVSVDVTPPPDGPSDAPCRLEPGLDCDFTDLIYVEDSSIALRTNPPAGARGVPAYTLISITFDRDMDAGTIDNDTFHVTLGTVPIEGVISYITAN